MVGLLLAVVMSLQPGLDTAAQDEPRHGLWGGGGFAIASVGFGGDAGERSVDRETGAAFNGRAGFAVMPRLSVGIDATVWAKESDGATATVWVLAGMATFYPSASHAVWIEGGLGALVLDERDIGNRGSGVAINTGVGYDIGIGRSWVVSPFVRATISTGVEIEQAGSRTGFTENPNLLMFGATFAWR